jgi:hypothetical protein
MLNRAECQIERDIVNLYDANFIIKIRVFTLFSVLIVLSRTGKNRHILDSLLLTGLIVMPQEIRASRQRAIACRSLFVAVVAAGLSCFTSVDLHAQSTVLHGYITAVRPPDGFDVNGEHVITALSSRSARRTR